MKDLAAEAVFSFESTSESSLTAVDDGNFEIHSGETINVDLLANDTGGGTLQGIIDPANPDVLIALTPNEAIELASGLGVELLEDGTFNVTGPSNPTERFVSFDYVLENDAGETAQATATFDWPIDTDGDGIDDEIDVDDDNDGILDVIEGREVIEGFTLGTIELTENGDGSGALIILCFEVRE